MPRAIFAVTIRVGLLRMIKNLDEYSQYLENRKLSKNTNKAYVADAKAFFEYLKADIEISKLTSTNIRAYILELEKNGVSPTTISRKAASVKNYFGYLKSIGAVEENIAKDIKINISSKRKEPEILSIDEIVATVDFDCGDDPLAFRDRAIMELIYATGLNATEITEIKTNELSLVYKYINAGKNKRVIPLGGKAVVALSEYVENYRQKILEDGQSDCLFVNYAGKKLTRQGLWKIIKMRSKAAGVDKNVTPKMLRQSFAVHMADGGVDIYSLSEMLGHSGIAATQAYMNTKKERLQEVYAKAHPRYFN